MYNLLIQSSSTNQEWQEHQGLLYDVSLLGERLFEHTEPFIQQQFGGRASPDFDALMELPCLFTYEGFDVVGHIGRISEVRVESGLFQIRYTLPEIYPKIRIDKDAVFQGLDIRTGKGSWEHGRTHWAVKDVDLFEITTRMLHIEGGSAAVLSDDDMSRVWGSGYRRKKLVFLSHRAEHRRQVSEIKADLERHRLCCFLAHEDIYPSKVWQDEILNALNTMDVFVGLVTDNFHKGGWPDQEIGYAYQRGVPRVFVKLGDVDPAGMVAREQALTANWESAAQEILEHLRTERLL